MLNLVKQNIVEQSLAGYNTGLAAAGRTCFGLKIILYIWLCALAIACWFPPDRQAANRYSQYARQQKIDTMKKLLLLLSIVCIRQIQGQIITTIAGNGTGGFSGDGGLAILAELNYPSGVAFDTAGNFYISDKNNCRIRKVNASGIISTVAGNLTSGGFSGDGGLATLAALSGPNGVAVDKAGNIYIADYFNNRVRKVNSTGIITTIAGNGNLGCSGFGGPAVSAELYDITVNLDNSGKLYISDGFCYFVHYLDSLGNIKNIAGNGNPGYGGDGGTALSAQIYFPNETAIDKHGNLFIVDYENNLIRKVNTSGVITTIAGDTTGVGTLSNAGYSGDGGLATLAKLSSPTGVAVDTSGNIFICDTYNYRVRKVNPAGIITTVAGNGTNGFSGDGGLATAASISRPYRVAVDIFGNLYISDLDNNRIRKVSVSSADGLNQYTLNKIQVSIYPNPTSDQFFIQANVMDKLNVDLYDVNGRHVISKTVNNDSNINVTTLDNGAYTLTIKTSDCVINKKLVIVR